MVCVLLMSRKVSFVGVVVVCVWWVSVSSCSSGWVVVVGVNCLIMVGGFGLVVVVWC